MAFPLFIEDKIVGVLFGGQIIVENSEFIWADELEKYSDMVLWDTFPAHDNHYLFVENNINSFVVDDDHKKEMLDLLISQNNQYLDWCNVSITKLHSRIDEFLQFGQITQQLINELHQSRKAAAEHQLLNAVDEELSNIDLAEPDIWWKKCSEIVDTITLLPEITSIHIYIRRQSRFSFEIKKPNNNGNRNNIYAHEAISSFPNGKLISLTNSNYKDLVNKIGIGPKNVWGIRKEKGSGNSICNTLILISGNITNEKKGFIKDLLGNICTNVNFATLVFREREADSQYRKKVGLIGHSFRTPLQALQFILEDLEKSPEISNSIELSDLVESGLSRIDYASEDLMSLLELSSTILRMENLNLITIVNQIISDMGIIAKNNSCSIVKQGDWPEEITVMGIRYNITRALTCLFDNAIKYSYFGTGGIYEVRVWVSIENNYAKIRITNFGIGIPDEKLKALRAYGIRGNVIDKKRVRLGSGLGLPFAIDTLENYGGWIHITSIPSERSSPENIRNYHRYITTVDVYIPIIRRILQ
jgi:signal transduction histidine kinase